MGHDTKKAAVITPSKIKIINGGFIILIATLKKHWGNHAIKIRKIKNGQATSIWTTWDW